MSIDGALANAFPEPTTITLEEYRRRNPPEPEPRPKEEAA